MLPPGTPAYRSPEAWAFQLLFWRHPTARYQVSPCDDLFALGITAYRLATGRYPPPTQPGEGGAEVWRPNGPGPRPPRALNAHVCPELDALILRLLSVSPMERFKGNAREATRVAEEAAKRAGPAADVPLPSGKSSTSASWVTVSGTPAMASREEVGLQEIARPTRAKAPTPRTQLPALALAWAGLAVAVLRLFLKQSPPARLPAQQEVAQDPQEEDSRDGGSVALGDSVSTAPLASVAPMSTGNTVPGMGVPLPEGPFPGQRKPPCTRKGEMEIRGGCWYRLGDADPPCEQDAYDWKGACYLPSFPVQRIPTSGHP